MVEMPNRIVFVFPANMTAGGMPDDTRQFIAAVARVHSGPVILMSRGEPADETGLLTDVERVNLETQDAVERIFNSLEKTDITVFITFSNLLNVRLARDLLSRGLRYSVLPAWQVHEFLDWDRPFARNAVPSIQSSEMNAKAFNTAGTDGVVEGRTTLRGFFRSTKRKVYRKTLGRIFLQNASGIHVYSNFERHQISRLVSPKAPNFIDVSFGTNIEGRAVGEDTFPHDGRKNIVFWGRADYYYKGLDIIVDGIALAKAKGIAAPFTFWVCGPDYNAGHQKLLEHVERVRVAEHVRILGPCDYTPGAHSVLGGYDHIIANRYYVTRLTSSTLEFCIPDFETNDHQILADRFCEMVKSKFGLEKNVLYSLAAIMFFSMLPLHNESPNRQNALLATGLRLASKLSI